MPRKAGPLDELIAKTPGWRGATLARLRSLVREADPGMAEDVKWRRPSNPNGSAVFTHDGVVCIAIVLKERVRLSFAAGASLPDPKKLFNAQLLGKSRAIDVAEGERLDERGLKILVRAAVARNVAKAKTAKTRRSPDARRDARTMRA